MADLTLSPAAAARINAISGQEGFGAGGLRVAVEGGGCSGFSYEIDIVPGPDAEDIVVERDGARLFVDPVSIAFLKGSEVDWVEEIIGSSFKVRNPNAKSSCGCGVSFSV